MRWLLKKSEPTCGPFKPRKGLLPLSTPALVVLAALAFAAASLANHWMARREPPTLSHETGWLSADELNQRAERAKQTAQAAQNWLREAKRRANVEPDAGLSWADSPWLGCELTPLVTTLGSLEAKRNAANPDWARVLTVQLYRAGVKPGTTVAAGFSGSFPGLNLALISACQALNVRLVAISSVTASTWGANQPGFTWPEIEVQLAQAKIIQPVSVAISAGGQGDAAADLEPSVRALAQQIQKDAATRLHAELLAANSLPAAVKQRLALYQRYAGDSPIVLYVNVGGNEASLGESAGAFRLRSGFIPAKPFDLSSGRGVIAHFAEQGVPTLSLLHIEGLAASWKVNL